MHLLTIEWTVRPQILEIGDFEIRWYGLLFATAFLVSYWIISNMLKREGVYKSKIMDDLTMYILLGTIIGARLGHCLFYEPGYYLLNPIEILKVWRGGLASHGGAIGILTAIWLFARKYKTPYLWLLDRLTIVAAISGVFIRLGNLFNSEIYGHQTDLPWGFIFVLNNEVVPKHPTQIYEALAYLLIFGLLYVYYIKKDGKPYAGLISGVFLILLFSARFFIEYVKEVQVEFEEGMRLVMGQILSLPFIIAGILLLLYALKTKKKLSFGNN